jgi:hypothetical protein
MGTTFDIEKLKNKIPYKWRVQSFSKRKTSASCVAYIDSRQVQDLLDDVVGPENWQDKYEERKGNLFCSIGIKINGEWVWKSDCGAESNMEKQKGESSDAFKRAAVKWGIGRFLYSLKIVYVKSNEIKTQNNWPYVVDDSGEQVWDLTEHISKIESSLKKNPSTVAETQPCPPEYLKEPYLSKNWNGDIGTNNVITFGTSKYYVNQEWADYLKNHNNYKKQ